MTVPATVAFERSHDIVIAAPAKAVFDYVTNPQSWPGLTRPSRLGTHCALLSGITGTSPVMTK
jgi:hypothetical protein